MFGIEPQLYSDLVIPANGTESNWVSLDSVKGEFVGIVWPATVDGTVFTVQATWDGGTTVIKVEALTFAASEWKDFDVSKYRGIKRIRLLAATSQTSGAATFKLVGSVI